jgi:hypothetical protein
MREEIAYQEMQEETAREQPGETAPDPAKKGPATESAADRAGSVDPTRKERAYPDLPSEGTSR